MGAATSLWFCHEFLNRSENYSLIKTVVIDSPFLCFPTVVKDKIDSMCLLKYFKDTIYRNLASTILSNYQIDINDIVVPTSDIKCDDCYFVVVGSPDDRLIKYQYMEEAYESLNTTNKKMVKVSGPHFASRPLSFFNETVILAQTNANK